MHDFQLQNPRNSSLFLWFCSIGSYRFNPNLSANSVNLFLSEPLPLLISIVNPDGVVKNPIYGVVVFFQTLGILHVWPRS